MGGFRTSRYRKAAPRFFNPALLFFCLIQHLTIIKFGFRTDVMKHHELCKSMT